MLTLVLLAQLAAPAQGAFLNYLDPVFAHYPPPGPAAKATRVKEVHVVVLDDMAISRFTHGEWGFAALVYGKGADGSPFSILFDTGAETGTVWHNVQHLKDPEDPKSDLTRRLCETQTVPLSHNHQDHVGGLLTLRSECAKRGHKDALTTAILGGPEAQWSLEDRSGEKLPDGRWPEGNYLRYPSGPGASDDPSRGTVQKQYEALGGKFIYAETPMSLAAGVWTSGKVFRASREKAYWQYGEDGPMIGPDGKEYHDIVPEDHGLVINTDAGVVVVTGCAHAGIVNMIQHARKWVIGGELPVTGIVGGIHLFAANGADLNRVREAFKGAGVKYLVGSHCTGFESVVWLRAHAGLRDGEAVVGTVGTALGTEPSAPGRLAVGWPNGPTLNRHPTLDR